MCRSKHMKMTKNKCISISVSTPHVDVHYPQNVFGCPTFKLDARRVCLVLQILRTNIIYLPASHLLPAYPYTHAHRSGPIHRPPFKHPSRHMAAKNNKKKTFSKKKNNRYGQKGCLERPNCSDENEIGTIAINILESLNTIPNLISPLSKILDKTTGMSDVVAIDEIIYVLRGKCH